MESKDDNVHASLLRYQGTDCDEELQKISEDGFDYLVEVKDQLNLGLPVSLVSLLDFGTVFISLAFIGHLGTKNLAGASMASSFANVTGFAVLEGLASGMETIGGQVFGSGQAHLLGDLLQRGQFVLVMISLAITSLWVNATKILLFSGQDAEIVALAGQYLLYLLPGLFFRALYLPLTKFLQVQSVTRPLAGVSLGVVLLHAPICWLFIHSFKLGFLGAASATSFSNLLLLIVLVVYLKLERAGIMCRSWRGWSLAAFDNVGAFLAVTVPACAMMAFEWWAWEFVQLMSGWLPQPAVAISTMTISFFTLTICFTFCIGLAAAASIRVSNELGAQSYKRANHAAKAALLLSFLSGLFLGILVLIFGKHWAKVFLGPGPSGEEVVNTIVRVMPFVTAALFVLTLSTSISGVLRGSRQQLTGSIVNAIALYGVGLPLSYVLGIKMAWGVMGLWTGMTVSLVLRLAALAFYMFTTDWELQVQRAILTVNSNFDTKEEALVY